MKLDIEWETGPAQEWLRDWKGQLRERRRELVRRLSNQTLQGVVQANPVETGRSRAAWVAAGEQLEMQAPGGWQGNDAEAMRSGAAQGQGAERETEFSTEISLSNSVAYVPILEYGSAQMNPRAMGRRTLQQTQQECQRIAQAVLLQGE